MRGKHYAIYFTADEVAPGVSASIVLLGSYFYGGRDIVKFTTATLSLTSALGVGKETGNSGVRLIGEQNIAG